MTGLIKDIRKFVMKFLPLVMLSYLVPRKKNLILFIHSYEDNSNFQGNVKYVFLYLNRVKRQGIKHYCLTESRDIYLLLKKNNLPAVYHPTLKSIWILLRTNILIVDNAGWKQKNKYYLLFKSRKVQLWHGIGFKQIELAEPFKSRLNNTASGRFHNLVHGKHIKYDLCVSTSKFYIDNVFSKAFRAKKFIDAGYPRNDIFFDNCFSEDISLGCDIDTISRIRELKVRGYKIAAYIPTFRETGGNAIDDSILDLNRMNQFARQQKIIFVFKFHILAKENNYPEKYDHIFVYNKACDVQVLLKISDILITDYSSTYMDYLLLDRPVVFFPYDYDKYIRKCRRLTSDYEWMTQGAKCYSQEQLEKAIGDYLTGKKDEFACRREEIRSYAFTYHDGKSSERILNFLEENYMKKTK